MECGSLAVLFKSLFNAAFLALLIGTLLAFRFLDLSIRSTKKIQKTSPNRMLRLLLFNLQKDPKGGDPGQDRSLQLERNAN